MSEISNEQLVLLTARELRELPALSPAQLLILQRHVREVRHRCGSLQTASGLPCERPPALGTTVCRKHGARAPQTLAKAERLLACARIPGIEFLLDELERANAETCPTCGFPEGGLKERKHIASVAFRLMDRTGLGPGSKIDFTVTRSEQVEIPIENWDDDEKSELRELVQSVRALKERVARRLAVQGARATVEGEVVSTQLARDVSGVKSLAPAVSRESTSPVDEQ